MNIPRSSDAPQFFNGKKCEKCVPYIQSNTIITDDDYNLFEGTIQAPPEDRKTIVHFTQDSQ